MSGYFERLVERDGTSRPGGRDAFGRQPAERVDQVTPVVRSESPIADADQRLAVHGFAEVTAAPLTETPSALAPAPSARSAVPPPSAVITSPARIVGATTIQPIPAPVVQRHASAPPSAPAAAGPGAPAFTPNAEADVPAPVAPGSAAPPTGSSAPAALAEPLAAPAATRGIPRIVFSETAVPPHVPPLDRATEQLPAAPPHAASSESAERIVAVLPPPPPPATSAPPAVELRPPAIEPSAPAAAPAATRAEPRHLARESHEPPAPAFAAPRIVIGRIEVEVVPPQSPAAAPHARLPRSAAEASVIGPLARGWRGELEPFRET